MINTSETTKYEGMGFVEALIAIMVVGISSVVLMQMAVGTMQGMIQNEVIDKMTQYAVEGSTMVQNIAVQERQTGENLFPDAGGECYLIQKVEGQYQFEKEGGGSELFKTYELSNDVVKRTAYGVIDEEGEYFRIFCISDDYTSPAKYAIVKVIVGQTNSSGTITKGNNVKDYSYFTVVNL